MKQLLPLLVAALPMASVAQSHSGAAPAVPSVAIPKTTEVLVIETAKQGVNPQQIMGVMPSEIRATVKLYFDGKIRQWYSRGDGRASSFWSTRRPRTRHEPLWKRCLLRRNT